MEISFFVDQIQDADELDAPWVLRCDSNVLILLFEKKL